MTQQIVSITLQKGKLIYRLHKLGCPALINKGELYDETRIYEYPVIACQWCKKPKFKPKNFKVRNHNKNQIMISQNRPNLSVRYPQIKPRKIGRWYEHELIKELQQKNPHLYEAYLKSNFAVRPLVLKQFKDSKTVQVKHKPNIWPDEPKYGD